MVLLSNPQQIHGRAVVTGGWVIVWYWAERQNAQARCTDVLTFHENDARKEDEYLLVHGRTFEIPIVQLEFSICPRSSFGVLIAALNFPTVCLQWKWIPTRATSNKLASHPGCGFSKKMDNHVGWARRPRKVSKLPTKRDPQNVMIASHHCFIGWSSKFARPERSSRSYRFVQKAKLSFLFCPWWLHRSLQLIGCVLFSPKSQLMAAHFPLLQCVPIAHGTLPLSCHSFFCSIQASVSTWHLKRPWCGPLRSVVSFWLWKDSRM